MSEEALPATAESRPHALLGGSTANRWVPCPGSVFYIRDMPPEKASAAALEGTEAHEAAEMALTDFLAHKETGTDPNVRRHIWGKNSEIAEHVEGYIEAVWTKVLNQSITGKFYELETALVLDANLDMSGYADFVSIEIDDRAKRVGVIGDFKYGFHHVSSEGNSQLAFYACALQETFKRGGKALDYVRAFIYQPRARGKEAYQEAKFTANQLESWRTKFFKAAESIFLTKKPKFRIGEHCRFCRAQGICTTYKKEMDRAIGLELVDIEKEELPDPPHIKEETLIQIVLHEEKFLNFVHACKKYAYEQMLSGRKLPGLKLVEGTTRRAWRKAAVDEVGTGLIKLGVPDPYDLKLRGITEIERELAKIHGKAEAKKLLEDYCPKGQASIQLAPETDPRPEATNPSDLLTEVPGIDE